MSLICHLTSEDIKHHFIIIIRQQYIQNGLRKAAVYRAYARLQYSIYRAYVRQQYIYTEPTSGSSIYIYKAYARQQYHQRLRQPAVYIQSLRKAAVYIQSGLRKAAVYTERPT